MRMELSILLGHYKLDDSFPSTTCMPFEPLPTFSIIGLITRAHAQEVKQSVCPSVAIVVIVVVVGTKIAISRLLGICACYKHNQLIDIGEKLYMCFKLLKKAY